MNIVCDSGMDVQVSTWFSANYVPEYLSFMQLQKSDFLLFCLFVVASFKCSYTVNSLAAATVCLAMTFVCTRTSFDELHESEESVRWSEAFGFLHPHAGQSILDNNLPLVLPIEQSL